MSHLFSSDSLWIAITLGVFVLLAQFQGKIKNPHVKPFLNPLLLAIFVIIGILLILNVPYESYASGGKYISLFVTPATVSLAIKLEKNFIYLKRYYKAILTGIVSGALLHSIMIFIFGWLFNFDSALVATVFPKTITTAIAVGVSESLGGIVSLTVALVVITGVLGAVIGEPVLRLFGIKNPVAQGVALGMSSHAVGTSKAIEMGDVQGAMSGVSIVVTGITVVILAPLVAPIINLF